MKEDDFFDLLFRYTADTEAPKIFYRWSAVTAIGAILGRQVFLQHGESRLRPNHYTMLVGNPGTRKSSAIKTIKKLVGESGFNRFSAEKTSKEQFLYDLQHKTQGEDASIETISFDDPAEMFIAADEFNEFVGLGNIEFLSLLGSLWDYPDEFYVKRLRRGKPLEILAPTISILGGNTQESLARAFPPEALGQGIMSRMIFVYASGPRKKIAFPSPPDMGLRQECVDFLKRIKREVVGEMKLDDAAKDVLKVIYGHSWGDSDMRFSTYRSRRFTHLLKLCMVMAAARCSLEITKDDVVYANTVLVFAERDMSVACSELATGKTSSAQSEVLKFLASCTQPADAVTIYRAVHASVESTPQLQGILLALEASGQVQLIAGRGYLPVSKQLKVNQPFVDIKLLRGAEVEFA